MVYNLVNLFSFSELLAFAILIYFKRSSIYGVNPKRSKWSPILPPTWVNVLPALYLVNWVDLFVWAIDVLLYNALAEFIKLIPAFNPLINPLPWMFTVGNIGAFDNSKRALDACNPCCLLTKFIPRGVDVNKRDILFLFSTAVSLIDFSIPTLLLSFIGVWMIGSGPVPEPGLSLPNFNDLSNF